MFVASAWMPAYRLWAQGENPLGLESIIYMDRKGNTSHPERHRTPDTYYYIPQTAYDAASDELLFTGVVTLEGVPWRIEDAAGACVYASTLTVRKNETQAVSVGFLPADTSYYIVFTFGTKVARLGYLEKHLLQFLPNLVWQMDSLFQGVAPCVSNVVYMT